MAQELAGRGLAQGRTGEAAAVRLAREFRGEMLLAVSPDGKRICLGSPVHETFILQMGRWLRKDTKASRGVLRVLDVGDWTPIYSGQFRDTMYPASFFSDGEAVFAQTGPFPDRGGVARQRAFIDLRAGSAEHRVLPLAASEGVSVTFFYAADGRALIGVEYSGKVHSTESLVRVELPDYREVVRVPFAIHAREPGGRESGEFFSADRKIMAYRFDHTIVVRRTADLSIAWTQQIERDLDVGMCRFGISADARHVAVALSDNSISYLQKRFYITVSSGNNGTELTRLRLSGTDNLAISPDGRLLAVGKLVGGKRGAITPTVSIHEVSSGRELGTVSHDPIKSGRAQFVTAGIDSLEFTSDGRYLISSSGAGQTKVWALRAN